MTTHRDELRRAVLEVSMNITLDSGAVLTDALICCTLTEVLRALPTPQGLRYRVVRDHCGDIIVTLAEENSIRILDEA